MYLQHLDSKVFVLFCDVHLCEKEEKRSRVGIWSECGLGMKAESIEMELSLGLQAIPDILMKTKSSKSFTKRKQINNMGLQRL